MGDHGDSPAAPGSDRIRYSNCWEDADVLAEALAPLPGARCLSIASAGDNALSLLAGGAGSVLAVDRSPAQLFLTELKLAAFRRLSHTQVLDFLGAQPSARRLDLYAEVRPVLSEPARCFWDERPGVLAGGVIHCGRLERYFALFRRLVLPPIHGRATVTALLEPRVRAERERFYDQVWDGWRWRLLIRGFFGRPVMARLGREAEFFRFAEGPVGEVLLERARAALTVQPSHDNPFLRHILTGSFGGCLPHYLRPQNHPAIREAADRVVLLHGALEDVAARLPRASFDIFNLSDVPEYMDLASYHALLTSLRPAAAPGARFVYWNLLVPRQRPEGMSAWLEPRSEQARALHRQARAFFYGAFVLEVAR